MKPAGVGTVVVDVEVVWVEVTVVLVEVAVTVTTLVVETNSVSVKSHVEDDLTCHALGCCLSHGRG